ncbi:ATP-dependent zinc metalloprotease FtsH [Gossypium australe]|uniref:ATP-dependent zinc metalloprotease FtsH n=1 Tax=Gossypium australe TaxID=47621 RepID=A0A5B6VL26_9ROSI|nr:ATP-dependent zinc metalloprotease FtsH [Gossypium australe]
MKHVDKVLVGVVGSEDELEMSRPRWAVCPIWIKVRLWGTLTTETGFQTQMVGDDALPQDMLIVLERVAGTHSGSGSRGGVVGIGPNVAEYWMWWLTIEKGTQLEQITWDYFWNAFQNKYVGASYVEARRREFMSLTQGDRTVAEYEAKILRLSKYACGLVATDSEGLRYDIKVLITLQRERVFAILVENAKIAKEVKRTKRERRDRKRGQTKFNRDLGPSSSVQWPKKWARF